MRLTSNQPNTNRQITNDGRSADRGQPASNSSSSLAARNMRVTTPSMDFMLAGRLFARPVYDATIRTQTDSTPATTRLGDRSLNNVDSRHVQQDAPATKPYLSTTDALTLVSSEGVQGLKNRWSAALGNEISLSTLVDFQSAPARLNFNTVNGQTLRYGDDFSRSTDPYINHAPGETPERELPSLTRNTQLIIAEKYAQKYGVDIKFVDSRPGGVDMDKVAIGVMDSLNDGKQMGIIVPVENGMDTAYHSVPIIFGNTPTGGIVAHVLDASFNPERGGEHYEDYFAMQLVRALAEGTGAKIIMTHDPTERQSDHAGCHVDALVVLKDGLRLANEGERPIGTGAGSSRTKVKPSMMKTTQLPDYWKSQDISKSEVYDTSKGRTLQEHIDKHTLKLSQPIKYTPQSSNITIAEVNAISEKLSTTNNGSNEVKNNGQTMIMNKEVERNFFLRAKATSYVDMAVNEASGKTPEQFDDLLNVIRSKRTVG